VLLALQAAAASRWCCWCWCWCWLASSSGLKRLEPPRLGERAKICGLVVARGAWRLVLVLGRCNMTAGPRGDMLNYAACSGLFCLFLLSPGSWGSEAVSPRSQHQVSSSSKRHLCPVACGFGDCGCGCGCGQQHLDNQQLTKAKAQGAMCYVFSSTSMCDPRPRPSCVPCPQSAVRSWALGAGRCVRVRVRAVRMRAARCVLSHPANRTEAGGRFADLQQLDLGCSRCFCPRRRQKLRK
jgi:hypothetical protein